MNLLIIASFIRTTSSKLTSQGVLVLVMGSWEQLKSEIAKAFSTDSVDIDHVKAVLGAYSSNKDDWGKFAYFDKYK